MDVDDRTRASIAAYDAHASEYQSALRLRRPVADMRRFADMLRRGDLVLDAGCGPATDLRLLRDAGAHPVGLDLSMGALQVARMLLPRHPLVCAPLDDPPFQERSFGGLWMSGALSHLPRAEWRPVFAGLLRLVARGPVYLASVHGNDDLAPFEDPVLGDIYVSAATEGELEAMFTSHGLTDVSVQLRPDPLLDRRRMWVAVLGRVPD